MIVNQDCLVYMGSMEASSVDAIVSDPPYGIDFDGKDWDHGVPGVAFWKAALRVAKPGAHLAAFGATRMFHRLAVAIEDAGWEIRDTLSWLYSTGMPKGRDISLALDLHLGAERKKRLIKKLDPFGKGIEGEHWAPDKTSVSEQAKRYDGWNTTLRPCWEPIVLARKPPIDGTIPENVLAYGTGGINIGATQVQTQGKQMALRWTPNVLMDEGAAEELDDQAGQLASRFFYVFKAGLEKKEDENHHPTVKPVKLMEWLVRLLTPPGGLVLDPFCGSGSTGVAAVRQGFRFVGCELDEGYAAVAARRLKAAVKKGGR